MRGSPRLRRHRQPLGSLSIKLREGQLLRIAFVTHYSKLYGANRSLLCLVDGLRSYGIEPHVLAPEEGPLTEELADRCIPFYALPFKQWMSQDRWKAPARLGANLAMLPALARKVSQWNVDLIHTNSSVTPVGALLAEILSVPHVWHVREFGRLGLGLHYDWGKTLSQIFMSRAEAMIAVSKAVRRHVLSDVDAPSYVVYNGVISQERLEQLKTETELGSKNKNPYTFAIVGRIGPAKRQEQSLRALHRLKQQGKKAHLLIAGDGNSEHVESLRQLRQSLNLNSKVSFLGYVSDPYDVYRRADAVLMCSPHEAMGRVTAEAMAAKRPVIGRDGGATPELIDDGYNGILYNGTDNDLAICMSRFIGNPGWAQTLGEKGWKRAEKKFTEEIYSRKIYNILRKPRNAHLNVRNN